ncbi:MAG: serine hydrolase [Chitinophagales bacterium]|nr:serine hydrolase [Chitinophagales bacterium]
MKALKKIILGIAILIAVIFIITAVTGNTYIYKALIYTYADIDDYKLFYNRTVENGPPQPWPVSSTYNKIKPDPGLQRQLDSTRAVAFLVLKNDSLQFEEYSDGYGPDTFSNSFSMAKSIISILIGIAKEEGKIISLDDPIGNYIHDFKDSSIAGITIRNLLMMTSGSSWDENYSGLFSQTTKGYYGTDLYGQMVTLKPHEKPGKIFSYRSGDTELLSLVLKNATGKTVSEYASEKLWKPLGAEHPALWSLDHKDGCEKAYCCFNSNARDFARIGDLYLHKGNWKGKQIVSQDYVVQSLSPVGLKDDEGKTTDYYGYQWWIMPERPGVFYCRGLNGQYIIVVPDKHLVIVRLGHLRAPPEGSCFKDVRLMIDWASQNF